jgi:hypothetical protein
MKEKEGTADFNSKKNHDMLDFHLNTFEMLAEVKSSSISIDFYIESIMRQRGINKQQFDLLCF